jgi:ParB family transcriptional regulator, chromosome partitioning protein
MPDKRPALGKGLSALIPDSPEPRPSTIEVDVDLITPNRYQPRSRVSDPRLEELAASIRANGVIQPIVVRRADRGYQIVAGERRWRAAQLAGLHRVPVVVREIAAGNDVKLLELALIENIQRENLNPIEEASAYRRLLDEFRLTQERVAEAVGKDRASIANYLRLLKLPEDVRQAVAAGQLSMGHARALLGLDDAAGVRRLGRDVVRRGLSVRATEGMVKRLMRDRRSRKAPARGSDVHTRAAEEKLSVALGTRTRIRRKRRGGTIEIAYANEDELQRLYEILTGR